MTNLLANPNFEGGPQGRGSLDGWQSSVPGTWAPSYKPDTPSPAHTACQCDQDKPHDVVIGWPVGVEADLWQIIEVPTAHSQIVFGISEIQHHGNNIAEIHIEGQEENGIWSEVWARLDLSTIPPVTPTFRKWTPSEYVLSVPAIYVRYRLRFYGRIDACIEENEQCGWKFTALNFEVA